LLLSEEREDARIEAGAICEQRPLVGSRAPRGTQVQAVMSKGAPRRALVPTLAGGTLEAATAQLQGAGLKVGATAEQPSETAKGLVLSTSPAAGAIVDPGTAVDLVVSGGMADVAVPDVRHKGISRARRMIEEAGLIVGAVRVDYDEDYGGNVVLRQTPAPGARAPKGAKVDLVINEADEE
jgi:serine/threonine-protein kinase